ncbi:unnamed protein product [Brassicogethes aeneus]|uniref:C3H1-type domain-containing protein n=1 Tax=Brassicogethes aeneus TaxID=1431903 RepID=A0A9P0B4C5_BRAAE|nr:unnamed protein product [Brassicogethes aeneus]
MSLVPDYGESSSSSSSDSSESDSETSVTEEKNVKPIPKAFLPKPNFGEDSKDAAQNSVFKNPFTEAENAKEAILQKHVKMVDSKDNVIVINGKKICWNYRKGRCRFGHNCKFAHDSDIQKSKEQLESEKQVQHVVVCQHQNLPQPSSNEIEKIKEESVLLNQKRRRPGLTQGLVPGKKISPANICFYPQTSVLISKHLLLSANIYFNLQISAFIRKHLILSANI